VVIDLDDAAKPGASLGDGFRVEAEIDLWDGDAVIRLPVAALFRDGASWAVFVAASG
jgi:HlyD family secretion protein